MASEEALKFNNIDDFLIFHTPDLKGALWIHNETTLENAMPFHGYNYLFDGILQNSKSINESEHSLFVGEQFSSPFFLGLIKENSSDMTTFLNQYEQTLINKLEAKQKLLVLTPLGKAMPAEVKKKLKNFQLNHVTYLL